MKKKQLPLNFNPPIMGYSSHAKTLAIVSTDDDYLGWFYSNYIHLRSLRDFSTNLDVPLDFYLGPNNGDTNYYPVHPFLYTQSLRRETLASLNTNLIDFTISCLDQNQYLDLMLEEYYLPCRRAYQRYKHTHDNLIFGYDTESQTFDILGYDLNRQYKPSQISFADYERAFESIEIAHWGHFIHLYNKEKLLYGPPSERYQLQLLTIIDAINDYLLSKDASRAFATYRNPLRDFVYGIDVYKNYLQNISLNSKVLYDIRPIHLLWEHKKCMVMRIDYLYQQGHLNSDEWVSLKKAFQQISQKMLVTRNIQLKYLITSESRLANAIKENLIAIEGIERSSLIQLLSALSRHNKNHNGCHTLALENE